MDHTHQSPTVLDQTNYLAEIAQEICSIAPQQLRLLGIVFLSGAAALFVSELQQFSIGVGLLLSTGACLFIFSNWLGGGPNSVWYRPAYTYAAITILYELSIRILEKSDIWNSGGYLLILGSAFCLRVTSDLWRVTVPLLILSLMLLVPRTLDPERLIPTVFFVFASGGGAYLGVRFLEQARLSSYASRRALARLATRDQLTGLPNRRDFEDQLATEIANFSRGGTILSIAIIDIDDFKRINDLYGHFAGDAALVHLASSMTKSSRQGDILARWGGEEFVVLFRSTGSKAAGEAAERIRHLLASEPIKLDGISEIVRASIGVATIQNGDTIESLVSRADKALYRAKAGGKNRVEIADADNGYDTPTATFGVGKVEPKVL